MSVIQFPVFFNINYNNEINTQSIPKLFELLKIVLKYLSLCNLVILNHIR